MGLFSFIEIFFFISLGVTILLIALLVYHFKQRLSSLEQKYDSLFDIVSNVVKQLRNIQTVSDRNISSREQDEYTKPSISQLPSSQYLGNNYMSMNATISSPEQYTPQIFHEIIDPSVEPPRFIVDYNNQVIRDVSYSGDTESVSESDSESNSESESDSDEETDSDTSYTKKKIMVSDDEKSFSGETVSGFRSMKEHVSNQIENVKIITLPTTFENIQDELNIEAINLHTEELGTFILRNSSVVSSEKLPIPTLVPISGIATIPHRMNSLGDELSMEEPTSEIRDMKEIVMDNISETYDNQITSNMEAESEYYENKLTTNTYIVQKVDRDEIAPSSVNELATGNKELYKKMTLPNLKATVIAKGLCSDPSKMKKSDLLKLLEEE
jgi:hypothetical protein